MVVDIGEGELIDHDNRCVLGEINLAQVGLIPRILLTTNGTLTHVLEACFLERIHVHKVALFTEKRDFSESYLTLDQPENMMLRRILLRGQQSLRNYVYAESYVFCDRVSAEVQQQLSDTDIPIGKILNQHCMESFKRFVSYKTEPAGELGDYFGLERSQHVFSRTFMTYNQQQPIMVITEKIPPLEL